MNINLHSSALSLNKDPITKVFGLKPLNYTLWLLTILFPCDWLLKSLITGEWL